MSNRLPNLTQITLAYLALPLLIFLLGWLKLIYALPLATLLILLLVGIGRNGGETNPDEKSLIICGAVALLWTAASGAGGFTFQTWDWYKHNAMLKALLSSDWPVLLGLDKSLVYTFGYYLPATAFGKLFGPTTLGWQAVNLAVYAWTAAGVWLTLLWFVHHVRWHPAILAPLFAVLGGMDIIGYLSVPRRNLEMEAFPLDIGYLQFSGMATALSWVPQHCIPAWLGAALFLQQKDNPNFYNNAMLFGACLILWSSFAALGVALLMAAWLIIKPRRIRDVFLPPNALLRQVGGTLLTAVVLLFILSSDSAVFHGFFAKTITEHGLWPRYVFFLLIEFGLVAMAALLLTTKGSWQRKLLIALCVILVAVPLYRVGWYHDMAMRASLPALFVFWCLAFIAFRENHYGRFRALALRGLIVTAVAVGSYTALRQEIRVGGMKWFDPPPLGEVVDISGQTNADEHVVTEQYHGDRQSFFFRVLAADEDGD